MNHKGTVTLETERLLLRPFCMEDAGPMFRNWASDPDVTQYLTWPAHENLEDTQAVLAKWTESYQRPDFYCWAIVPNLLGEPVGTISVVFLDERSAKMEIGYCLGKAWWHQGLMPETLRRVMAFLFEEVGALRIEAKHDTNNPNSGTVMRKCGMTYEGTLRQYDWNNQGICDAAQYSILAEEWRTGEIRLSNLTANEYQRLAMKTLNPALDKKDVLINGVMGLCGESGEAIDLVKKHLAQGHVLNREGLIKELGDVAWYLAETAYALDVPLDQVLTGNIRKLRERYPEGFDWKRSVNRKES